MDLIPSTGPHLHIVLNHLPIYGSILALGLFLVSIHWKSWFRPSFELKSADVKQASLVLFVILGIMAIPSYISGAAARWAYQGRSDVQMAFAFSTDRSFLGVASTEMKCP